MRAGNKLWIQPLGMEFIDSTIAHGADTPLYLRQGGRPL